jgi:5'-3' exonuclease
MGVPKLVGGIIRQHFKNVARALLKSLDGRAILPIDIFSIDGNGLLYKAANTILNLDGGNPEQQKYLDSLDPNNPEHLGRIEDEIVEEFVKLVIHLIKVIKPQVAFHLAIDGLVPMGKIESQRIRRLLGVEYRETSTKIGDKLFDTTSFSPGTSFMRRLDARLEKLFQIRRGDVPWPPRIMYWSHLTRGEGEHKLMEALRKEPPSEVVIVAKDADLVFLALLSHHRVQIVREELNDILDIEELRASLNRLNIGTQEFCFLLMLIGNDFLPTQPGFNEVELSYPVMQELLKGAKFIDENGKVIWGPLREILKVLAPLQRDWIEHIAVSRRAYPFELAQKALENTPNGPSLNMKAFRAWWISRSFQLPPYGPFSYDETQVQVDRLDYLSTIEWVFNYYRNGHLSIDWSKVYRGYFAPLLMDLVVVTEWPYLPPPKYFSLTPLGHLLLMMPSGAEAHLPKFLIPFFEEDSPMRDLHPKKVYIWHDGNNKEHFGVAYLPKLDPRRALELQSRIVVTQKDQLLFETREVREWITIKAVAAKLPPRPLPLVAPLPVQRVVLETEEPTTTYHSKENQQRIAQLYGAKVSEMIGTAVYPDRLPLINAIILQDGPITIVPVVPEYPDLS